MIRVGKESRLSPSETVQKAMDFFGPSGLGLAASSRGEGCVRFEGGGGFVVVLAQDREGKVRSKVTIEGREWEQEIKRFLGEL